MQEYRSQPTADKISVSEQVNSKLKNGYKLVFQAQTIDKQGDIDTAKHLYYQASSQITRALSVRCTDPSLKDELRKATFVLNMVKERIRVLEDVVPEPSAPPQDDDIDLSDLLNDMDDIHAVLSGAQEAKEIMHIDSGISLFNVEGNGEVIQKNKNASAKISHILSSNSNNPVSCLQIGELLYPLVSKASPVLQVGEKQFMFPSLDQANKYIGVVLENVDQKKVAEFQRLIMSLTNLHVKSWDDVIDNDTSAAIEAGPSSSSSSSSTAVAPARPAPPRPTDKPYLRQEVALPRTVDKVSGGIQTTAEIVSAGMVWGSKKGGELIRAGANSLKDRIKPATDKVEISEHTQEQLQTIRHSTDQVSVLTGQAVSQLASGISALAKLMAPHVTKGVKHVMSKNADNKYVAGATSRISEQNVKDACQLAASGLQGMFTLYEGLEESAKNLGRAMAEGTNVTVSKRYGEAAGQAAEDSMHTVGNVGLTYSQAKKLGGKAIAKTAAKSTAAEVVRHNAPKK